MPRKKKKKEDFNVPASILKRLIAFVADLLIINLVVSFALQGVISKIIPVDMGLSELSTYLESNPKVSAYLTAISIFIGLIAILYFAVMEHKLGQSLGKKIMNIYVVSDDEKLKFWQCLVRSLFLIPAMPFMLLWIIDPIYMLFNPDNKRLSEFISKTKVVEVHNLSKVSLSKVK